MADMRTIIGWEAECQARAYFTERGFPWRDHNEDNVFSDVDLSVTIGNRVTQMDVKGSNRLDHWPSCTVDQHKLEPYAGRDVFLFVVAPRLEGAGKYMARAKDLLRDKALLLPRSHTSPTPYYIVRSELLRPAGDVLESLR
jgi:hypothetical protein